MVTSLDGEFSITLNPERFLKLSAGLRKLIYHGKIATEEAAA